MPRRQAAPVICAAAGCARLARAAAGAGRLFCADHQQADVYWGRVPCLMCLSTQHAVRDCVLFRERHAHPPPPERAAERAPPPGLGAQLRAFFAPPAARWHCTAHGADGVCFWYRAPEGACGVRCALSAPGGGAATERAARRVEESAGPWWALALRASAVPAGCAHAWCADMPGLPAGALCAREPVPARAALRTGPPRTAVPAALAACAGRARRRAEGGAPGDEPQAAAARDEAFASAERELHEIAVDDAFVYAAMEATAARYRTCPVHPEVFWVALSGAPPLLPGPLLCTCAVQGIFAVQGAANWHRACVEFALYHAAVSAPRSAAHAHAAAALQVLWEWACVLCPAGEVVRHVLKMTPPDLDAHAPGTPPCFAHTVLRVCASVEVLAFTAHAALVRTDDTPEAHTTAAWLDTMLTANPAVAAALLVALRMRGAGCWVVPFERPVNAKELANPLAGARADGTNRAARIRAHACTALDFRLVAEACGGARAPAADAGDASNAADAADEADAGDVGGVGGVVYEHPLSILTREQGARYTRLRDLLGPALLAPARGGGAAIDLGAYQDPQPVFVLLSAAGCAPHAAPPGLAGLWVCAPCDSSRAAHAQCAAAHAEMHCACFDAARTLALWRAFGTPALPALVRLDAGGFKTTPSCGMRVVSTRGLLVLAQPNAPATGWAEVPRHAFQSQNLPRNEPAWVDTRTRTTVLDGALCASP